MQFKALTLQPDGKLVAAGFSNASGSSSDFALARYSAASPPPPGHHKKHHHHGGKKHHHHGGNGGGGGR